MKYLLLFSIRVYWLLPGSWRRSCIFKCSCSHYVYQETKKNGFINGIRAFRRRFHQCRPGYGIVAAPDGKEWVVLMDLSCVERAITNL
jgi:putative component of membrane protein insertase Oxa1/YidC/SpoIIIJ protein YidD